MLTTSLFGCGDDELFPSPLNDQSFEERPNALGTPGPDDWNERRERIYLRETIRHENGEVQSVNEEGVLDYELFQRAARPYLYGHEEWLYTESDSSDSTDDGLIIDRYEIYGEPNLAPLDLDQRRRANSEQPVRFIGDFETLEADPAGNIRILVQIRDFPLLHLPLTPPPHLISIATAERLSSESEAIREQRSIHLQELSADFQTHVSQLGGRVMDRWTDLGWLVVEYPRDELHRLSEREDIGIVQSSHDPTDSDGSEYTLGGQRVDTRVGLASYWNEGHKGGTANSQFHGLEFCRTCRLGGGAGSERSFDQ